MIEEKGDYTALICDDCREEIFVDVNMYMVKDKLWESIIAVAPKLTFNDALCVCCMEKRLGRAIERTDWKVSNGVPPCNLMTEEYINEQKQKV